MVLQTKKLAPVTLQDEGDNSSTKVHRENNPDIIASMYVQYNMIPYIYVLMGGQLTVLHGTKIRKNKEEN